MGIHGSPTCTMEYDGAVGYLMGGANAGMRYMFTIVNTARRRRRIAVREVLARGRGARQRCARCGATNELRR
jgi:alkylation response protein AidB-like acyl-CoA dehydrogenase